MAPFSMCFGVLKAEKNCHALTVSDLRSKTAARSFIRDKVARFMMEMKATKKIYFVRLESGDTEVDPDEGDDVRYSQALRCI